MDQQIDGAVEPGLTDSTATDASEITPEQMQHVAGGQNGAGGGPPPP